MAEGHLVFPREWIVQINEMLYNHDDESSRPKEDTILRVATPLLKTKPEAYIPQFLSIGPCHHSKLDKDIQDECAERKISRAETHKGKVAATLSKKLDERRKSFEHRKSFKSIVDLIEEMRPEIDRFYHWPDSSSTTQEVEEKQSQKTALAQEVEEKQSQKTALALMMAVDSSFLLHFLKRLYIRYRVTTDSDTDNRPCLYKDMIELDPFEECIQSDILKLENQIPLSVMESVFEKAKEALQDLFNTSSIPLKDLNQLLHKTFPALSPFNFESEVSDDIKQPQPHLLGYMHAFVSSIVQMQTEKDGLSPTLWTILKYILFVLPVAMVGWCLSQCLPSSKFERKYEIALSAEKLDDGGIKFKLLSKPGNKIRLDIFTGTLYLPQINVFEMYTKVLLRNLVAWEFSDVTHGTNVMHYVGLMDSLIQTPEDVRVLRHHRVIGTDTVTDECIAKMWNELAKPFFTGQLKLAFDSDFLGEKFHRVLSVNYYKSKICRMVSGFFDLRSNWKFYAFAAGFLGLALSAIQTYCTWYEFHHSA